MSSSLGDAIKAATDAIEATHGAPGDDPSLAIPADGDDPTVVQLVYSLLLWEAGHELAGRAFAAIRESLTGLNELRVCDGDEVAAILPREISKREERAMRLVAALNAVFISQHGLTLERVVALPKREARQYFDALDGVPPFVAARVSLLATGGHAVPADDRIAGVLSRHKVLDDPKLSHADLVSQLERAVRAADAPRVYALLELDALHTKPVRKSAPRTKARAAKKQTSKSTPKATGKGTGKSKAES